MYSWMVWCCRVAVEKCNENAAITVELWAGRGTSFYAGRSSHWHACYVRFFVVETKGVFVVRRRMMMKEQKRPDRNSLPERGEHRLVLDGKSKVVRIRP